MERCQWALHQEIETHYHDTEWGIPNYDDRYLFEMINLEGQQAGLSWYTILSKREGYREAFANFEPEKLIHFSLEQEEALMDNAKIVRHRLKIKAIVTNAHAYFAVLKDYPSFSDYVWSFVDHQPIVHDIQAMSDVPAQNDISLALSKSLKKYGFKFVGPTTVYAFMQAVGMVNDHANTCAFK